MVHEKIADWCCTRPAGASLQRGARPCFLLTPSRVRSFLRDRAPFLSRQLSGSRLSALPGRFVCRLRRHFFGLTRREFTHQLRELVHVARTLRRFPVCIHATKLNPCPRRSTLARACPEVKLYHYPQATSHQLALWYARAGTSYTSLHSWHWMDARTRLGWSEAWASRSSDAIRSRGDRLQYGQRRSSRRSRGSGGGSGGGRSGRSTRRCLTTGRVSVGFIAPAVG